MFQTNALAMMLRGQGQKLLLRNSNIILRSPITIPLLRSGISSINKGCNWSSPIKRIQASHYSTSTWRRIFESDTGIDRYTRLNRFQQYGGPNNNNKKNSLGVLTFTGLGIIAGVYFISPYLFQYVPPFTYFQRHPKSLVYGILGVNFLVFGLWQLPRCWPLLQKYMLLSKTHVTSKWSLIGSAFSHQEFWHLGMNMLALWSFGTSLVQVLGVSDFFSLYMGSAITGSLFSLWYPRIARLALMGPSLGASGALFGVLGCFSYLFPASKILLFVFPVPGGAWVAFLASLAWNGAGCVLRWGSFDYAAHLGGSLLGVFYGWYIKHKIDQRREKQRRSCLLYTSRCV